MKSRNRKTRLKKREETGKPNRRQKEEERRARVEKKTQMRETRKQGLKRTERWD